MNNNFPEDLPLEQALELAIISGNDPRCTPAAPMHLVANEEIARHEAITREDVRSGRRTLPID